MMEDKLTKKQSNQEKKQVTGTKSKVQLQKLHPSGEQLGAQLNPTRQKRKKDLASVPEEVTANLNIKSLQMQLIKVNAENKLRNDRISELEDHIFQFQKFQTLRGTESQADQGLDESKILAEKLRGCEVIVEEKAEESRSLRKKLSEMERSYQQVRFEYDALKDKLASVRELESYDSHSSEEETERNGGTAKSELLQRVKNLEGLLRIKEMSEKELTQVSKELESQLSQKRENERLLNLRCAKFDQLTKQKEDVERKLEERYSQVEQMQKEREELEEENQEQMKMLLDEIKERDEAYAQLEMINKDLSRKTREMEETRICLEAKIDQLKMDLEEGIHREVIIKKQFSDLEQTVRDWEHIEQQLREQFKRVEGKLNTKIKRLRKRVEEKDEALERSTQAIEELKKSGKEAEHLLHERQKIPPEILQEKVKLEEELSRMAEAELIKAGSIVKMTSRFEMELNEKSRELDKLTDEIESLNEEIGELQEQLRQHKESERKLQERNKMMEELLQDMQEGESKMLQDKIARMEKLLLMKEDTEEKLQVRIGKQVSLLKEMAETQRRLAQRNEELGLKQRRLSEDLHQWRVKFSDLEKGEREARNELIYQKDRVNELEAANSNLKVQLKNKSHEFEELDYSKKEKEHLMAELNKKIEELGFKESVCQAENASLETHLKKRTKELEASEASKNHLRKQLEETLEGKEHEVKKVKTASEQERRVLETHLFQKSLLITSLETMIQEERQLSVSLKHEVQNKELAVKKQQEKWLELQTRIQGFKQDLEEAKSERTRQVHQSDTLRQRLEECVQSEKMLKKTISNFIKAEAALQSRIQDLERAEKQLLGKIDELNSKSLQTETNEPHLAGKLQSLQVSERTLTAVLAERERADAVVRRNLWHSENHLRMKEEEVKKQCEYFEHHQQKQRQQLAELREREHWMQDRVYELERGMVESKAANAVLRAELQKATANASLPTTELPEEGSFPLGGLDDIKNHIETLEQDLKRLLEREEAGDREKEKLRHSLQQAEDNKDFLGHKLEDLRSRIQELKLSEGSLQEQVEELEGETRKLRAELEVKQESEEYLREVLEEKEKLKLLMEERCQPPENALNKNEPDFNTGEVQLQQDIAQKVLENFQVLETKNQNILEELEALRNELWKKEGLLVKYEALRISSVDAESMRQGLAEDFHTLLESMKALDQKLEEAEKRRLQTKMEKERVEEDYELVVREHEELQLSFDKTCYQYVTAVCQLHEFTDGNSEVDTLLVKLSEVVRQESSKHKQLSSLCSAIFHHVVSSHSGHCTTEEQSSPSRYRDLKNSLSHLRSQLQNGDILFREELLREKWASLLDPSRNKAIQTPSIGQCVQEAMIIAKLASECIYDYPKLSEAIKEGRLTPLMESHSSPLAEMMQALRSSDVEQVRVVLKRPETQKELARLLGCEREQLAREEDISSSLAEKPGTSERVQENTKYGDDIINTKEITRHVVVTMDLDIIQSQAALLEFANQKVPGTKPSSTFLHTRSICDHSEPDSHNLSSSQLNMHEESSSTEAMTYTGIIATLEAEIQKLQTEKAELDQHLQGKHSLFLKATAERSELQKKLCASESQVNDLSQKLDAVMQEKMKEEETMKNNLRKENEVLEKRNKELHNRIAKQETERREMEAEFQEAKENSLQNVSKLVEEKQKLEQQLTSVQRVNAQQLLECHQTAQEMDAQNEELKKRIAQLEIKDKILVDATTGLKEEIEKGKQENDLLFNKINRLENEKAEAGQRNAQLLKRENEELSEKVNILESKAEQYDAQITALQHKLNSLEHENSKLMRLKENLIEGMDVEITDEKGKLVEAAETLEQPNEQSLEDTPLVTENREAILKTEQVFSLSKGLVRQKYVFNDALAESPVEKDIEGAADDSKLGSNEVSRQEECVTKLTREVVGLSLAESLVMSDTASEVVNYCDQNELLECATQEKDELNKVQQSVLMEAEAVFAAGDVSLKPTEEESQAKEVPVNQPRIENDMTNCTRKELALLQQVLPLKSCLKDQTFLQKRLQQLHQQLVVLQNQFDEKAKVEVSLRADNSQLKEQLCALDEWSCKAQALEASSELMKREFEKMGKRKTEAELLVAPLKVKVSCLVQKCHNRNSLIVRLVKELHGCGFINMGLMEEAEDLLNDTAVLEYTNTFLPSYSQVGNMKISGSSAGNPDQGLDPNNLGSLSSGRETIMDSGPSLTYKSCVANADYHPSANMPHTVLPVLSLSVGDMIRVTGFPDSHGLYHTEVNGILGLVPASFLEEVDDVHHAHTPQSKSILNPQLSSPERILEFYQQLQQGHSSNYQVTPSMTIFSPNEEPVEHPLVSRLHNELECPISETCRQTTVEQQAQHHLLPSADPAQCYSGDCSADDLKSTQGCMENTSETCQLVAAGCNLSDVLTLNLRETYERCTTATTVQGVRGPTMAQEPPLPVVSVRIIKTVGQSSLMVDWEKPCVDEKGSSNDTSVQGYRIFIDGEFHKSVMGSDCTKTVLEDLDLTVPFQVSVQTVGVNSLVSGKVTVLFQNCRPQKKSLSELSCLSTAIHSSDCTEKFQEIKSSQDCSLLSTRNPKARMFLAIYDYHPLQDSPNIHPSHELAFKEGDIVWTLGKQRRDGFYEAEVNGRRGLAPVSFLEEVNIGLPKTLQQKADRDLLYRSTAAEYAEFFFIPLCSEGFSMTAANKIREMDKDNGFISRRSWVTQYFQLL